MTEDVFVALAESVDQWSDTLIRQKVLDRLEKPWAIYEMMHYALAPENLAAIECPFLREKFGIYSPIGYLKRAVFFWVVRLIQERRNEREEVLLLDKTIIDEEGFLQNFVETLVSPDLPPDEKFARQECVAYLHRAIRLQPALFQKLARLHLSYDGCRKRVDKRWLFAQLPYQERWCYARIWPEFCKSMRQTLRRLAPNKFEDLLIN